MQAARGTPLTPDESVDQRVPGARRGRLQAVFWSIALTAYAVDVISKSVAVARLTGRPDVPLVGEWLQLSLTRNPGAAFSTATEYTYLLSAFAVGAFVVVVYLSRRLGSRAWAAGLGLLLAGIAGNLTDRIVREPGPFRGEVVDFFRLPNWPVFNVADICINLAAAVIVIQALRGISIDGSRKESE